MILVVSFPDEDHTVDVVRRLESAGHEVTVLDLADHPAAATLSVRHDADGSGAYSIGTARGTVDLTGVRAAWWRRLRPFQTDASLQDPSHQAFVLSETGQAMHGLLEALGCHWVNPPRHDQAAQYKPYQWAVAHELGLRLPRTLVTNDPDGARAFVAEVGVGRTVYKAFLASTEAWRETRLVRPDDLARMDAVRLAPVIFQEYVPGVDLRVTVVGDDVFATEIDATATTYPVDMRMVVGEASVRPVELPPALAATLLALVRRLGLVYGAIDLRRRADGEYVFFEINPAGQWLFCEQRTGLPITQAVADLLGRLDRTPVTAPLAASGPLEAAAMR